MTRMRLLAVIAGVASLPVTAVAQQDEQQEATYVYATYMYCDTTRQDEADAIVEKVQKPIMEAALADGTIQGWGWLAHHTGGKWRRIRYHTAPSMDSLLAALETIGERLDEAGGDDDTFGQICNGHDDYIWKSVTGSGGDPLKRPRGKVGISAYHKCKMSRESRADELVKLVFAPIYDAHVGEGKLSSWGWSEHIVGGKYRRLSTMTADDWSTLMNMRESIFDALQDNELADEFVEICGSHSDYLWEIRHQSP
jgi:hypothetical protein